MHKVRRALFVYILFGPAFHSLAQQSNDGQFQYSLTSKTIVEDRLGAYARKNVEREPAVRRLFEAGGCTGAALTEEAVKGAKAPNLVCALGGATDSMIVVGAHFDLVEAGAGVIDNWTGAALLSSLYQGLAANPRHHTYVFVAFSGEERGLLGSRTYVQELGDRREKVKAMVNLDSLGLSETKVWISHSDRNLVELLATVASALNLPLAGVNVEAVGSTDSESFRQRKIPAITLHSLTQETWPILHTKADNIEAVHLEEYYRTYRLLAAYLAVLDQKLQ